MKKKVLLPIAYFALLTFFLMHTHCTQRKTFTLSFTNEKGRNLKYDYSFSIDRIYERSGKKIKNTRKTNAVIDYLIQGSDKEGNIIVTLSFDLLSIYSKNLDREYTGDTRKSIGVPVIYTLNYRGKVIEVKGIDELPVIPEIGLKGEYDLISLFFQLPERQVKINDTWTGSWTYSQRNVFNTTYKLMGVEEKYGYECLKIETSTEEIISGTQQSGNIDMIMSGEAHLEGVIYFAWKEGIIVEKSYKEDAGNLTIETSGPRAFKRTFSNYAQAKFVLMNNYFKR